MRINKKILILTTILLTTTILASCTKKETEAVNNTPKEIKVGYFPSISHAPAMVGLEKGFIKDELGDIKISTQTFPDGSIFMDALLTGQVDLGYVGPGPVINRYLQGGDVVLISNVSVGENVLVVRNDLNFKSLKDLEGKIVATPSTGCTHDLILRKMLKDEGLAVEENGGKVKRLVQKPSTMVGLFKQGQIDAAVVSEPWASQMEAQGVAKVVRDVNEVPWKGDLPAAVLVVKKDFLQKNPEVVQKFISANNKSIDFLNKNKQESIDIIANQIKTITGQELEKNIIESSLKRVKYVNEINKVVLQEFADLSKDLDFIKGDSSLKDLIK